MPDVADILDQKNNAFTREAKAQLADLSIYSSEALEWLMAEHFQFSFRNTEFLMNSANTTGGFDTPGVKEELLHNYDEEKSHAEMYRRALAKVGVDVAERQEFKPTTEFLDYVGTLCEREPSSVLGTMFATETAAIYEHEVFKAISEELIRRREHGTKGKPLVAFHDLHLDGVEQAHREDLAIFLRNFDPTVEVAEREGDRPTIKPAAALEGGNLAIDAMVKWWEQLFAELRARSQAAAAA